MWPNPQFPADVATFTEKILNGELHFLCSVIISRIFMNLFRATGLFLYPLKTSEKLWFSDVFREYRRTQARWNGLTVTACVTEWLRLGMFRSFKCQTGEFSVFCIIITPFIIINITQLTVLFCNCPLLKDISFNTKCLLVWCD